MVFKRVQCAVSTIVIMSTLTVFNVTAALPLQDNSTDPQQNELPFELVSRAAWGGKPPTKVKTLAPPPFVIIHHTYLPTACYTTEKCKAAMRSMQRYHQEEREFDDIGYNFVVGSEGRVYEGPGWDTVGTHAAGYNSRSLGICLIGDWRDELPPKEQLDTAKQLIAYGVLQGYIPQDYTLIGHRQVRATTCPGQALFNEIQTWHQYSHEPSRP